MHVYQVLPVTAREMQLKLERGIDACLEYLESVHEELYYAIDPERRSAV